MYVSFLAVWLNSLYFVRYLFTLSCSSVLFHSPRIKKEGTLLWQLVWGMQLVVKRFHCTFLCCSFKVVVTHTLSSPYMHTCLPSLVGWRLKVSLRLQIRLTTKLVKLICFMAIGLARQSLMPHPVVFCCQLQIPLSIPPQTYVVFFHKTCASFFLPWFSLENRLLRASLQYDMGYYVLVGQKHLSILVGASLQVLPPAKSLIEQLTRPSGKRPDVNMAPLRQPCTATTVRTLRLKGWMGFHLRHARYWIAALLITPPVAPPRWPKNVSCMQWDCHGDQRSLGCNANSPAMFYNRSLMTCLDLTTSARQELRRSKLARNSSACAN